MRARTVGTLTANAITADLLLEIPKRHRNSLCWRNNTGAGIGWGTAKMAMACIRRHDLAGAMSLLSKRMVTWGLVGSSDIIMVLGPDARFIGIEVKDPETGDSQTPEQMAFECRIRGLGGIYIIAESVEQCLRDLEMAVNR